MRSIRARFRLAWHGVHGVSHWSRVLAHARHITMHNGAHSDVADLFAVLHDVARKHDGDDPEHGPRAATFACELRQEGLIVLPDDVFTLLEVALRGHSIGHLNLNPTVQSCWDADRLDLGRVGIYPDIFRLGTDAARDPEYIAFAYAWSQRVVSRRDFVTNTGLVRCP